ncbi:hypothetical protein AA0X95_00350 [Bacillus sp. 1P10SD]|uniref:hypothetical protein n=1 Tax=Bacillus sp. 1P10SD TaxID=3132265 RepID=UPI0039A4EA9C
MPINLYASPTLDKETRFLDKDDGKWQKEIGEKRLAICLQMVVGHAHCAVERE